MTLDWWGLGLQAINVLILVWLLSRVFWRPVAGAISGRQKAALAMLDDAKAAQAKADAALAEVEEAKAGIAADRETVLADAKATAEKDAKTAMAAAQAKTDALVAAARADIDRNRETARKDTAKKAVGLSVEIAAKLLGRFNTPGVQAAFRTNLIVAIVGMSASDRATLTTVAVDIDIVTATDPETAERTEIERTINEALGGTPCLRFVTDPDLIAGLELRSAHFVLHNSWRADLQTILNEVENAG
ncbi:ATP synthase F0 subunit B [Yoonia vestfoldensis]|uniref:ATP synthase F0 subunit B n=1 Tax=Yoonia vestfoldensis TaxID=245188 RepID=UPI0003794194|nr:ATP synthase F0 subunit B [Yoonia vestfoldensis]